MQNKFISSKLQLSYSKIANKLRLTVWLPQAGGVHIYLPKTGNAMHRLMTLVATTSSHSQLKLRVAFTSRSYQ